MVLSHVDSDQVTGLLDYFADLRLPNSGLPVPSGLWHNCFAATVDPQGMVTSRLAALITPGRAMLMSESGVAVQGIEEGAGLRADALALQIPTNHGFPGGLVTVDGAPRPLEFDNLEITVSWSRQKVGRCC